LGDLIQPERLHRLVNGHPRLAVKRVDGRVVAGRDVIFAHGQRVTDRAANRMLEHHARLGAEHAKLGISSLCRGVEVGLGEEGVHSRFDVAQPDPHGVRLKVVFVVGGEPEPRSRRARQSRGHARREGAESEDAVTVVDRPVGASELPVSVAVEELGPRRLSVLRDLFPLGLIGQARGLQPVQAQAGTFAQGQRH
jgi:hypothetical protein